MKVKRFNNLWTMGLIIFGALLVGFYVLKMVCPQFIVGVAEIPSIVKFGNFVDSNLFAFYFVDGIVSLFVGFIHCAACCRKRQLSYKSYIIIIGFTIFLYLVSYFIPHQYMILNCAVFAFMPFVVCIFENNLNGKTFISTSICVFVDFLAQVISMEIKDITLLATHLNSATFFIMLIDVVIWRMLFYFYFNCKEKEIE
jgi:hypothetical protein